MVRRFCGRGTVLRTFEHDESFNIEDTKWSIHAFDGLTEGFVDTDTEEDSGGEASVNSATALQDDASSDDEASQASSVGGSVHSEDALDHVDSASGSDSDIDDAGGSDASSLADNGASDDGDGDSLDLEDIVFQPAVAGGTPAQDEQNHRDSDSEASSQADSDELSDELSDVSDTEVASDTPVQVAGLSQPDDHSLDAAIGASLDDAKDVTPVGDGAGCVDGVAGSAEVVAGGDADQAIETDTSSDEDEGSDDSGHSGEGSDNSSSEGGSSGSDGSDDDSDGDSAGTGDGSDDGDDGSGNGEAGDDNSDDNDEDAGDGDDTDESDADDCNDDGDDSGDDDDTDASSDDEYALDLDLNGLNANEDPFTKVPEETVDTHDSDDGSSTGDAPAAAANSDDDTAEENGDDHGSDSGNSSDSDVDMDATTEQPKETGDGDVALGVVLPSVVLANVDEEQRAEANRRRLEAQREKAVRCCGRASVVARTDFGALTAEGDSRVPHAGADAAGGVEGEGGAQNQDRHRSACIHHPPHFRQRQ